MMGRILADGRRGIRVIFWVFRTLSQNCIAYLEYRVKTFFAESSPSNRDSLQSQVFRIVTASEASSRRSVPLSLDK